MPNAEWAQSVARGLLAEPLPRRWAHTRGVAAAARSLSGLLGENAVVLRDAAWLHDVGYAPALVVTGFHPLDGARFLRRNGPASDLLCSLVAHHSCALTEAKERGLEQDLAAEFERPPADLSDALIYCDMTTSPDGRAITIEERITEITTRYGPGDLVTRAITRSAPELSAAVGRVSRRLASLRATSTARATRN